MTKIIVLLMVFPITSFFVPSPAQADQVTKNSVILKEVREVISAEGVLIAKELIYEGGISGIRSTQIPNIEVQGAILRELRAPEGVFTFTQGETTITVKVLPQVAARHHDGMWKPAIGRWDFQNREINSYESVVRVKKGGDLDIFYQSTGMKVGRKDNVVHYGLSGNPHAVSLSRTRLKNAFAHHLSSSNIKPVLNYQPSNDVILVQMELTPEGLVFQPIFDYQVLK